MLPPPEIVPLSQRLPAELPLMMGVGPTPVHPDVARANSVVLNHLGPTMNALVEGLKDLARYAFQTRNERVFGVSGPGSACIEMAVANLVWPGRRVLSVVNGTFSERAALMAERVGGQVTRLNVEAGHGVSPEALQQALQRSPADLVTMVHGETSCGAFNRRLPELAAVARAQGALVAVDAVVTLTTVPLQTDDWGLDVVFTAGQKGLASIPGVSLITFSDRAWKQIADRPDDPAQWVLDARLAERFWMGHTYHYTAPTPGLLAIYEALRLIAQETLPARHARHARYSAALQAGVQGLGLQLFAPPEHRLNSAVAIRLPKGVTSAEIQQRMEHTHNIQVAGAFGLPIFRIGQMGEQCRDAPLTRTLDALAETLNHLGHPCDGELARARCEALLAQD